MSDRVDETLLYHQLHWLIAIGKLPTDSASRFQLLRVPTTGGQPLAEAILASPAAFSQLRSVVSRGRALLDFWAAGTAENHLANLLECRHTGQPKTVAGSDSKATAKAIFKAAKVQTPDDFGCISTIQDLFRLYHDRYPDLKARGFRNLMIKLNREEGGTGIARLASDGIYRSETALRQALHFDTKTVSLCEFESAMRGSGALVECEVSGRNLRSPSGTLLISANGHVELLATHDQIVDGCAYTGCRFPADIRYRHNVAAQSLLVARECARRGWRGPVSVDFVVDVSINTEEQPELYAIEINARKTATFHPFLWTKFLTDSRLDPRRGELIRHGMKSVYEAREHVAVASQFARGPKEVIRMLQHSGLLFDATTNTGMIPHHLAGVRATGKIGVTAVARTHEHSAALLAACQNALRTTGSGGPRSTSRSFKKTAAR
ncbi:hypothetical protein E1178_11905 [Roseibium hamelinense]|uniref:peptide ligase PGM1-related protein n=1 Tax=Roseibium hamelinense TaxID=150831 RepID=UPI0011A44367|nr:peptide ligase PGM1-related protein [Roseibium hamelinense]MTI44310.1 hypothetical protein [Roseibium hamelinense]